MPKTLGIIPNGSAIVDREGGVNLFFRQLWESLRNSFQQSPTVGTVQKLAQTAALAPAAVYTTRTAGLYRVSYYLRKTVADGVTSSLTFTWRWTETGLAQTEAAAALALDSILAEQSGSKLVWADANTDLGFSVAYASNTPGAMAYRLDVVAELMA